MQALVQLRVFFGPHLGADVFALRHKKQVCYLANQADLVRVKMGVCIGHAPHGFNHPDFLRLDELLVHAAGEMVVVISRFSRLASLVHQLRQRIVRQGKPLVQSRCDGGLLHLIGLACCKSKGLR